MKEYKGMRVFPPDEYRNLALILSGWTDAARSYGFRQYATPLIDPIELYTDKTSDEILRKQTYRFNDRAGRDVVLRPEITPGMCSMVLNMQKNRTLRTPFRGFTIGSVFRYENPQKGRTREHRQFNADIFGEKELWAEAEVIQVIFTALKNIGFRKNDFTVRINDRSGINTALEDLGVRHDTAREVLGLLDGRGKTDPEVFETELKALGIDADDLDNRLNEPPESVQKLTEMLTDIPAVYDPRVIRGFNYYTGIVFEVFSKNREYAPRSVAGGGRYDTLIESYGGSPTGAVGFGMGDVTLLDCLAARNTPVPKEEVTVVYALTDTADAYRRYEKIRGQLLFPAFIGAVPREKTGGMYKKYEEEGARYAIGIDGKTFAIREMKTRKTVTVKTEEEVIRHIRPRTPWYMKLFKKHL